MAMKINEGLWTDRHGVQRMETLHQEGPEGALMGPYVQAAPVGDVPQVFERSMFKCHHPRQRGPDGRWMVCAAFDCAERVTGVYYVVPIWTGGGYRDHVYRRVNTMGGMLWRECA